MSRLNAYARSIKRCLGRAALHLDDEDGEAALERLEIACALLREGIDAEKSAESGYEFVGENLYAIVMAKRGAG